MIPTITFDLGYFIELGTLPFPLLLLRVFLDGGWIFILYFAVMIGWHYWVEWRQELFAHTVSYCVLAIDVPMENEQTPKAVEQIFNQISGTTSNFDFRDKYWYGKFNLRTSFELVSIDGYVQFAVRCPVKFRDTIEAAVYAQYPDAEITQVADYADAVPTHFPDPEWDMFGTEFVLKKEDPYPIKTYTSFEHNLSGDLYFKDPIGAFLEPLSQLKKGEQMWIQFILMPIDDSWKSKADSLISKLTGRPAAAHKPSLIEKIISVPFQIAGAILGGIFFPGAAHEEKKDDKDKILRVTPGEKALLEAVENKISKQCFQTKIRLVYIAKRDVFNKGRFVGIKGAFNQFGSSLMNSFKGYGPVTPKGDYFWQRWHMPEQQHHLMQYYKERSDKGAPAFILSAEELATIYHFPYKQVKAPLVKKTEAKRSEPPSSLPTPEFFDSPFRKGYVPPPKADHGHGGGGSHGKDHGGHDAKHDTKHNTGHDTAKHNTHEKAPPTTPVFDEQDEEEGMIPPNLPMA
jgi:hypothetical protein